MVIKIKNYWRKAVAMIIIFSALAAGVVFINQDTPNLVKEIDSRQVTFSFSDNNKGENLIIRTEKEHYDILVKESVLISITNESRTSQDVVVKAYFGERQMKINSISEILDEKVESKNYRNVLPNHEYPERPKKAKSVTEFGSDAFSSFIASGETKYFEAEIDVTGVTNKSSFSSPVKFFIEAIGTAGAYGHLDPDVSYVQFKSGTCGGSCPGSTIASASFSATSGNLIVALVGAYNNGSPTSVTGVTDTAGNTYTQGTACAVTTNGLGVIDIWYAKNITGHASNVVTATIQHSGSTYRNIYVHEYSGADTSAPFELCSIKVATSATTITTDSFSLEASGNVNAAILTGSGSAIWAPGTNYTEIIETDGPDRASMHRLSAPSGSQTASASTNLSSTLGISLASFKPAGVGGGGATSTNPSIKVKGGTKVRGGVKFR